MEPYKKAPILKIYYLASTHWDREWYRPFQGFRYRLVGVMNRILDVLEKQPEFETFMLDGQTIVLDDFTQIEREQRERLVNLIRAGRLVVGPWYVMPDEYLVSGESLIQNLLMGRRVARRYGAEEPLKYGYVCDVFGHIAQLPQIFNQCGIQGALLGRGTNVESTPAHFLWESPDGSRCITFKVPEECGYGTFWMDTWLPFFQHGGDREELIRNACAYIDRELERSGVPYVVLMDGMDHEGIHSDAPWLAKRLENIYGCPVEFRPMSELPREVEAFLDKLPVHAGELNQTGQRCVEHNMLISNTLSSRYDIKKANDECQVLLEKWVAPLMAQAALEGHRIPATYLEEAYRLLLQCHAHDSICGCSIDEVHRDMQYRFRQSRQIAHEVIQDALAEQLGPFTEDDHGGIYRISISNPLPFEREEIVTADIWFVPGYEWKYCEQVRDQMRNAFRLLDAQGNEISYKLRDIRENQYVELPGHSYHVKRDIYTISFAAKLAPSSLTEFTIVPSDTPVRCLEGISSGLLSAENEWISLTVENNGTLTLCDKDSGKRYEGLLSFVDDSETGDGWFHAGVVAERAISSRGFPASVELLADHRDFCVFRVISFMRVPQAFHRSPSHLKRSEEEVELRIQSDITFSRKSRGIDITVQVDNNACDHRLRLLLPTGIADEEYEAGQTFCSVRRRTGVRPETATWKECEKLEKAFDGILLKRDVQGNGLAFISAGGLHEGAGWQDSQGTLAVTLFRSFGQTFLTDGQPDGQLQGRLEFRFRIQLLTPEDYFADLVRTRDAIQAGLRCYSRPAASGDVPKVHLPLCTLTSKNVVQSVMKPPEDGEPNVVVIRLVNFSSETSNAKIKMRYPVKTAFRVNLMEEEPVPVLVDEGNLDIQLAPYEIATYRLRMGNTSEENPSV